MAHYDVTIPLQHPRPWWFIGGRVYEPKVTHFKVMADKLSPRRVVVNAIKPLPDNIQRWEVEYFKIAIVVGLKIKLNLPQAQVEFLDVLHASLDKHAYDGGVRTKED